MSGYFDPAAEAESVYKASVRRRTRLEAAVRGWVREKSSARWTVFIYLCGGAAAAAAFAHVARGAGVATELCALYSVMLMWLVFALLLRWRAGVEARRIDLEKTNIEHFILHDELELQEENRLPSNDGQRLSQETIREVCRSVHQTGGGTGVLVFMVLGSATLGVWVIWQLVRAAPTLLSQVLVDAVILPENPRLSEKVPNEPWRGTLIAMTALHFICLAFVAAILSFSLPYLILAIQQGPRR